MDFLHRSRYSVDILSGVLSRVSYGVAYKLCPQNVANFGSSCKDEIWNFSVVRRRIVYKVTSVKTEVAGDNVSVPSSFIANAHNELYAFYTGKTAYWEKNSEPIVVALTVPRNPPLSQMHFSLSLNNSYLLTFRRSTASSMFVCDTLSCVNEASRLQCGELSFAYVSVLVSQFCTVLKRIKVQNFMRPQMWSDKSPAFPAEWARDMTSELSRFHCKHLKTNNGSKKRRYITNHKSYSVVYFVASFPCRATVVLKLYA